MSYLQQFTKIIKMPTLQTYFSFDIGLFKNVHFKSKKSPPTPILYIKLRNFMDTDRFWNKSNFEVVPLDKKFAISFFFYFWPGNMKPARP